MDGEIIDLTDSPLLAPVVDSEDPPPPSSINPDTEGDGNSKKKQRKRKRKSKPDAQSRDATASNTRENSEEGDGRTDHGDGRRVGRKHQGGTGTKENDLPSLTSQDQTTSKKQRQKNEDSSSSSLPLATGNASPGQIFFEDTTPAPLPSNLNVGSLPPPTYGALTATVTKQEADDKKLLLPAHVSVLGSTPVEILSPTESGEEGDVDYIKYLDYGGNHEREFLRYFEKPEDEALKLKRTVCKHCSAEGDHKTAECRVLICLTCGVRDEHVTKSCPVSKVCFSCGMKGHINSKCPNRRMGRTRDHGNNSRCNRCYSELHQTSECPTWWRLYTYMTSEDRRRTLSERRLKRDLEFGKGGEGYIAEDDWCYNCGENGHWGDDCKALSNVWNKPNEPSAFGLYNLSTGPFYDQDEVGSPSRPERRLRDWERGIGAWNMHAPDGVGRQGRKKAMDKMRKTAQRFEEMDDPQNWFENASVSRNRSVAPYSGPDRGKDRQRNRDKDRHRDQDRDKNRQTDTQRDRDNGRQERDGEERRERNRDRARGREREKEREQERTHVKDYDRNRDRTSSSEIGVSGKLKINISQSIGAGRRFDLLPRPPELPARPPMESRPSLLERMGARSVDDQPPKQGTHRSNGGGPGALSIKGAGHRDSRDNDRGSYRSLSDRMKPQYHGGYGR